MNTFTQSNLELLNNYGVAYPTQGALCGYLFEIKHKVFSKGSGIIFDESFFKSIKGKNIKVSFKIGAKKFTRHFNTRQPVKYGAVIYAMAVILMLPVKISSRQFVHSNDDLPIVKQVIQAYVSAIDGSWMENAGSASKQAAVEETENDQTGELEPDIPFYKHIMQAANAYQVDAALIQAIIMAESSYNPKAVSHRGAQGLMQLMPTTAKWLGVEDTFDPALNIDGGVRYFKRLLDRFNGDIQLALAAYNAGSRYVLKYGGVPPFRATRIYIKKVLNYHRRFRGQAAAGDGSLTAG